MMQQLGNSGALGIPGMGGRKGKQPAANKKRRQERLGQPGQAGPDRRVDAGARARAGGSRIRRVRPARGGQDAGGQPVRRWGWGR